MTPEEIMELENKVDDAVSRLAEHADSVRVFVSLHDEGSSGSTKMYTTGRGNFLAQYGQVCEWKIRMDEESRCLARKKHGSEDGGEDGGVA